MANNKVVLADGTVLIDLTADTVATDKLLEGYTAHDRSGNLITGTAVAGAGSAVSVVDTLDSHGGTIRTITAVSLAGDTVSPSVLLSGYTAHNALGEAITGTASGGGGTINLQEKSATPTTASQNITPDAGYDGLSKVVVGAIPSEYVIPSGTKAISTNGTHSVSGYANATVDVQPSLQAKSATPSESAQTIQADSNYDGLSSVSVGAISSTYVGSEIDRRSSSNLTVSGATVTAPAGYYASAASKSVSSGSAATPATSITANPSISVSASGLITASVSASQSVTPSVTAGYVSSGTAGTVSISGSNTQQLTTKAAATITPGTTDQTIAAGTYLTGAQTIAGDADLVASNILSTANIFGVQGEVTFATYYTGSSAPASSLGVNGDIYLKTGD